MYLSVVVPCFNEGEVIPLLVTRLTEATAPWKQDCEIILVDDGSTDNSWSLVCEAAGQLPNLRGLRLSANRGHQIALSAGLEAARGERVFMLDADLQDPPEILADMMAMMDRGYDVVYGRRVAREGETLLKRLTAFVFYRMLNLMSDVPIPKDTGDFRLVSRRALDALLSMPEGSRFIRGMFAWVGFKQIGLDYVREPRAAGTTKYPLSAMLKFAVDATTSFSTTPLRIATRASMLAFLVSFMMGLYVGLSYIAFDLVPGWASILGTVSFFSGIQLAVLGIIGEYLGRLYLEAKRRPLYFVDQETRKATVTNDGGKED